MNCKSYASQDLKHYISRLHVRINDGNFWKLGKIHDCIFSAIYFVNITTLCLSGDTYK